MPSVRVKTRSKNSLNGSNSQSNKSFFQFSSILKAKYPRGRVGPSIIPKETSKPVENASQHADMPETHRTKPSSISVPRRPSEVCRVVPGFSAFPFTTHSSVWSSKPIQKRNSDTTARRRKRFLLILLPLLILLLLIIVAITTVAVIHIPNSSTTTTTTVTTTTYTSATTTTTTTSTTSTSTTSTSTSTSTTSTSTSTTSVTTTTDTTATTTTDSSSSTTTSSCYFGEDYVNLVEGGRRQILALQVGDRVWTLSEDGQHLIEDEIMCIPHARPTTPTDFYTFTTIEGHSVSLTGSHYIVVKAKEDTTTTIVRASDVTLEHQLVITGRTIAVASIEHIERIGFYSPISYSGYLLVNNISTSVYVYYLPATHEFHHRMASPFRLYYRVTRWLFGNNYEPFPTDVKDDIHPLSAFVIANFESFRIVFSVVPFIMPMIVISFSVHFIPRVLSLGLRYD